MRKSNKRLKFETETVRSMGFVELGNVVGGYPTQTHRASACTVGSYTCETSSTSASCTTTSC